MRDFIVPPSESVAIVSCTRDNHTPLVKWPALRQTAGPPTMRPIKGGPHSLSVNAENRSDLLPKTVSYT
jgi:hypothetical protein